MKITFKKFKFHASQSRETTAFTADVYADDILIAHARNDGGGGMTQIDHAHSNTYEKLKEARNWALTLPPIKATYGELPMDFEFYLNLLANVYITANNRKNKANGFVLWSDAQQHQHNTSGVESYPEFRLWHIGENSVYYPTEQVV